MSGMPSSNSSGPDAEIGINGTDFELPAGWDEIGRGAGVQLVETDALVDPPG